MIVYSPEQKIQALVAMLLGIASAAKGTGLDTTIQDGLNEICPVEAAMVEARGYGFEKGACIN